MGYIKSLEIIILVIHLVQAQPVTQEEVLELDQGGLYTSINNYDLYVEHRKLKQGQYLYPVIFKPIKNIRLSISSYQVTTSAFNDQISSVHHTFAFVIIMFPGTI